MALDIFIDLHRDVSLVHFKRNKEKQLLIRAPAKKLQQLDLLLQSITIQYRIETYVLAPNHLSYIP
jgi:hypothetical protein